MTALVPGHADPHTYEPAPAKVKDVTKADLVVINGLGLEETLHDLIYNNVRSGVPIVEMAEGLPVIGGSDDGNGGGKVGGAGPVSSLHTTCSPFPN